MSEKPKSNHSQAAKANVQFRAFRRRVTMESADSNCWRIMLDGKLTDLIVTCFIHDGRWAVSKTSGEIVARNCRSATEAEDVAVHYLCSSPPGIVP
jgi:hypothetical protein